MSEKPQDYTAQWREAMLKLACETYGSAYPPKETVTAAEVFFQYAVKGVIPDFGQSQMHTEPLHPQQNRSVS